MDLRLVPSSEPAWTMTQNQRLPARTLRTPNLRVRRWLFAALVVGTTGVGTAMMLGIIAGSGITALEITILCLFVPTFSWISVAFWNALLGFLLLVLRRDPLSLGPRRDAGGLDDPLCEAPLASRTALVMPAFHEETDRLVRGLESVVRSVEATGEGHAFGVHLLSDSTLPAAAQAEREAWSRLCARVSHPARLHYRRRVANVGRKAGNIADFCKKWGSHYDYIVVLDADSVMSGSTLVELVRTMDANPKAGFIQTVPIPASQVTLLGRFIQFAGALYSPMLSAGQSFWQGETANYFGHNAILRMRPFIDHCRLPVLPGRPPLGGEILSHDFVEAALLRRAGWYGFTVHLGGSYEEVPGDFIGYAKRDRRWAQGSLQHLRLLTQSGLKAVNRIHFALGAMGYISSVLWLLLLFAGSAYVLIPAASGSPLQGPVADWLTGFGSSTRGSIFPLLALTALVLFTPKVLGVALGLMQSRRGYGGAVRLVGSALLETLFSVLVAPLMMMVHTRAVVGILAGRNVEWGTQARGARGIPWSSALRSTASITALGVLWAGTTLMISPSFLVWLAPIFAGLLLSAPIVRVTARRDWGAAFRRWGVLTVPSESSCPPELANLQDEIGVSARPIGEVRVQSDARDEHEAQPGSSRRRSSTRVTVEGKAKRSMHEAERGLFDLRRGRPLFVTGAGDDGVERTLLVQAVEGLDAPALTRLNRLRSEPARLVVTTHRARYLNAGQHQWNGSGRSESLGPLPTGVSLLLNGESPEDLFRLAGAKGPFVHPPGDARRTTRLEASGLALTRLAGMLPAAVTVTVDLAASPELRAALTSGEILSVHAAQIEQMDQTASTGANVVRVSEAPVPLDEDENARFVLFRETNGLLEHVAILIGDRTEWPDPVPVRLHSACLTGDLFGSLRCDCGEQLRGSLEVFAEEGGGVLLYLAQEGRGIGLGNKLRAYTLQEQGLDTVDADSVLGFGPDERGYAAAVGMLRDLDIQRVRLLTNNPEKIRALEEGGIQVPDRQPLHGTLNRHNLPYVRAKVQRAGHWLGDMLHGAASGK